MEGNKILEALSCDHLAVKDIVVYIQDRLKQHEELQTRMENNPTDSKVYKEALKDNQEVIKAMKNLIINISDHKTLTDNEKGLLKKMLQQAIENLKSYMWFSGFKINFYGLQEYLKGLE